MKILGIGNAIVDVICKVSDSFIDQNNLTKSTMKLFFDENEFKSLLTNLKIEKTVSGGSVANSIVGLSQLGDKVGFIGKVSDDNFIEQNNLTKSTMKLFFDENEFKHLLNNQKIEKTVSGGSVANSIVGLSQLCDEVGFIGKVSDDDFGSKYEEGLKKENVEYLKIFYIFFF